MIIRNLNIVSRVIVPLKANAPLIVNADAELSNPVIGKFLQMVGRWNT